MKLLTYTRFLRQKIKFYDKLITPKTPYHYNPFKNNENSTTIVWVEDFNEE
ncbi:hypothetical protein J6S88_04365 [bacterium]|nr:hypothetical protein [bacterium]